MRIEEASLRPDDSTGPVPCCIVGSGPAGMMLGLLLARAGVRIVVLEKHAHFLRDFRGDTIHPSTLEVMHELGLLEALRPGSRHQSRARQPDPRAAGLRRAAPESSAVGPPRGPSASGSGPNTFRFTGAALSGFEYTGAPMRFGTYYFLQAPPHLTHPEVVRREIEQMVWTEELGFDSIWLTEHHFIEYGLSVSPSVLAAAGRGDPSVSRS